MDVGVGVGVREIRKIELTVRGKKWMPIPLDGIRTCSTSGIRAHRAFFFLCVSV